MPIYIGLRFRLIALMTTLLVVTVFVLYELNRRSEAQILQQVEEQTTELTAALEIGLRSISDTEYLDVRAHKLMTNYQRVKHILVTDSEGVVTDSIDRSDRGKKIQLPKPECLLVAGDPLSNFEDSHTAHAVSEQSRTIYVPFRAVGSDGWPETNYVVVVMSSRALSETLYAASRNRLVATMVVLCLGLLITVVLVRRFTNPLRRLTEAAQRVAGGDLKFHLGLKQKDEMGQLAKSFDQMIDQLREKHELEERLNQAERAAVIGRLASGIAHEIRNPLNFINLTIDHVRTRFAPPDTSVREVFDRLLHSVKEEIARLNSLVNNVLRFGRPARLSLRKTRLAVIVGNVFQVIRAQADEQGVQLQLTDHSEGMEIVLDADFITSCFSNLAINAVQAMPDGGQLTFVIECAQGEQVVTVTDQGSGIPEDKLDQIFEPYYSTKETGIGLGLAVTRKLIEEHHGNISVTSVVGRGTTFTIRLPEQQAPAENQKPEVRSQKSEVST